MQVTIRTPKLYTDRPLELERALEWQTRTLALRTAQTPLLFALVERRVHERDNEDGAALRRFLDRFFDERPKVY